MYATHVVFLGLLPGYHGVLLTLRRFSRQVWQAVDGLPLKTMVCEERNVNYRGSI